MLAVKHLTLDDLEAEVAEIRRSPKDDGILEMIVRRPATDERELLQEAQLDLEQGLVGDNWHTRGSSRTRDRSAHREMQLTIMNVRTIALVAQTRERWQLAGDQLYIDMDLSVENMPPGTRLSIGSAVIEVTSKPHSGCKKFMARFGLDALTFVNSAVGKQLRLRGLNARVIQSGTIRVGNRVQKI